MFEPYSELGFVDEERARLLADAGLERLHRNLDTCESHPCGGEAGTLEPELSESS